MIDGVTYTVVDEAMLRAMVENEQDVTKLATTKVTDMEHMFAYDSFFQPTYWNWDVSNVTDMNVCLMMLMLSTNPLVDWDVSNVTDMQSMFRANTS